MPTQPEPHRNPNSKLTEPVFIFTDNAIVPPPKDNGAPSPSGTEHDTPERLKPEDPPASK